MVNKQVDFKEVMYSLSHGLQFGQGREKKAANTRQNLPDSRGWGYELGRLVLSWDAFLLPPNEVTGKIQPSFANRGMAVPGWLVN